MKITASQLIVLVGLLWILPVKGQVSPGNLALHAAVSASSSLENTDWGKLQLTDGIRKGSIGAKGWSSDPIGFAAKASEWVEVDLGKDTLIDRVVLCPRNDAKATSGGAPGFPVDIGIEIKPEGGQFSKAVTILGEPNPGTQPRIFDFARMRGRYIRMNATRLSLQASTEPLGYRCQLAEIEVYDLGPWPNLALHAKVTASASLQSIDWSTAFLTDGIRTLATNALGWTSDPPVSGPMNSVWVQVDLGKDTAFDEIVLFARIKMTQVADGSPNFPVDYRVESLVNGAAGAYSIIQSVVAQPDPKGLPQIFHFGPRRSRYIRVFATRLGNPSSDETSSFRFQLGEIEVHQTSATTGIQQTFHNVMPSEPGVSLVSRNGHHVVQIHSIQQYQVELRNGHGRLLRTFDGHGPANFILSDAKISNGPCLVTVKFKLGKWSRILIPSN
jgi:F5/8 type C domain